MRQLIKNYSDKNLGNDYTLDVNQGSIWITAKNVSIWILPEDEGVSVFLYRTSYEMDDELDSAYAPYAAEINCQTCGREANFRTWTGQDLCAKCAE